MSSGSKAPSGYQPTGQAQADQGYQQGVNSLAAGGQQLQNTAIPGYQSLYSNVQNNPYYAGAQQAAGNTAQLGQQFQQTNHAAAGQMGGFAQQLGGYAQQFGQTAFDPQSALYNRMYQQQMDQQNAINAQYGVAGSPYGAGVAGQTANNFNIDWQNQQLARQLQGLQGLSTAGGAMGQAYGQASNLDQSGILFGQETSQLPYQTYLNQQGQVQSALDALVQGTNAAYGPTQQAIGDYGNYMNIGQSATRNAQQATQMNNANQASFASGLGKLAGAGLTMFANPLGSLTGLGAKAFSGAGSVLGG